MKYCNTARSSNILKSYIYAPGLDNEIGILEYSFVFLFFCLGFFFFCPITHTVSETMVCKIGFHCGINNIRPIVQYYHNLLVIQQIQLYSYSQWTPQESHFNIVWYVLVGSDAWNDSGLSAHWQE